MRLVAISITPMLASAAALHVPRPASSIDDTVRDSPAFADGSGGPVRR